MIPPFENQTPKSLVFRYFRYSDLWYSGAHCNMMHQCSILKCYMNRGNSSTQDLNGQASNITVISPAPWSTEFRPNLWTSVLTYTRFHLFKLGRFGIIFRLIEVMFVPNLTSAIFILWIATFLMEFGFGSVSWVFSNQFFER
jgi:hypothetical protein